MYSQQHLSIRCSSWQRMLTAIVITCIASQISFFHTNRGHFLCIGRRLSSVRTSRLAPSTAIERANYAAVDALAGLAQQRPNVFVITSEHGGLGHRISAVALGIAAALEADASVILDEGLAAIRRLQDGVSYPYLRRLFNLYMLPTTSEVFFDTANPHKGMPAYDGSASLLTYVPTAHVMQASILALLDATEGDGFGARNATARVFVLPTGHARACVSQSGGLDYCVKAGMPGAYDRVRPLLAAAFAQGEYGERMPRPLYARSQREQSLIVAWYVRNDDIKLYGGRSSYWQNLVGSLLRALSGLPADHYLFSQWPIEPDDTSFGFLHRIPGWSWKGLHSMAVPDAIRYMAAADILVHSGSSFSLAAGLVGKMDQIALFPLPKESTEPWDATWRTYWLKGSIAVGPTGSLEAEDEAELRHRVLKSASKLLLHRSALITR